MADAPPGPAYLASRVRCPFCDTDFQIDEKIIVRAPISTGLAVVAKTFSNSELCSLELTFLPGGQVIIRNVHRCSALVPL